MSWIKNLFVEKKVTTKDLQAELRALCDRMIVAADYSGLVRYQSIREELYKRGVEPKSSLVPKGTI